ncbi:MAG: GNAT family N-acetyltransferase [Rhodospirillales bacterium]|nr:GNAT family N-acetyltransferase [Rhodospirillales bacterium]
MPEDVDIFTYESGYADELHALIESAFSAQPPHARPKDSTAYLDYMQGPSNPAGRAIVAATRKDGVLTGNISATPFHFTTRDGRTMTGYQLGSVVVGAQYQREGIGGRLVRAITAHLDGIPDSFTYIYPNTRSEPVLRRNGYRPARDVPTYIHFPAYRSFFPGNRQDTRIVDRHLGAWSVSICGLADALAIATDWPDAPMPSTGFTRGPGFFRWRFGGPGTENRYRFAVCRREDGDDAFALSIARHAFSGIRFAIPVDLLSQDPTRHFGLALKAAQTIGGRDGERFVYVNSNIPRLKNPATVSSDRPWGVPVPSLFNPRPVRLLYYPRDDLQLAEELDAGIAMTGDWMGF